MSAGRKVSYIYEDKKFHNLWIKYFDKPLMGKSEYERDFAVAAKEGDDARGKFLREVREKVRNYLGFQHFLAATSKRNDKAAIWNLISSDCKKYNISEVSEDERLYEVPLPFVGEGIDLEMTRLGDGPDSPVSSASSASSTSPASSVSSNEAKSSEKPTESSCLPCCSWLSNKK